VHASRCLNLLPCTFSEIIAGRWPVLSAYAFTASTAVKNSIDSCRQYNDVTHPLKFQNFRVSIFKSLKACFVSWHDHRVDGWKAHLSLLSLPQSSTGEIHARCADEHHVQ
jgi:hypothetical protein